MADDIDIEEHDVLDNPAIKSMFPDLAALKKEISHYFEDEPEISKQVETCSKKLTTTVHISRITDPDHYQDASIQKNSPLITCKDSFENAENLLKSQNDHRMCANLTRNRIILGSKPSKDLQKDCFDDQVKPYKAKVLLQDLHTYLHKSKRYCKDCLILFPNKLTLNTHNKNVHSPKNNNICNTTINSKIILGTVKSKTNYRCGTCSKLFSCSSNLSRHYKNVHKNNLDLHTGMKNQQQIIPCLRNKRNISKEPKMGESNLLNHACFHCQKSFSNRKSLIEHLYNILDPMKIECHECSEKFTTQEKLNDHILAKHKNQQQGRSNSPLKTKIEKQRTNNAKHIEPVPKECEIIKLAEGDNDQNQKLKKACLKNVKPIINIFQCPVCSYCLNTMKAFTRHMNNKHKIKQISQVKKVAFNSQCKYCPSKSINAVAYNTHVSKYHRNKLQNKTFKKLKKHKVGKNQSAKNVENHEPLESHHDKIMSNDCMDINSTFAHKSILFKCNKCDIHFLSSIVAMKHLDHMEMLINWKCSICQRIFKKKDEVLHLKQHSLNDQFTVYNLCERALARVLYNCPKCTVHYTEESYLGHYSTCVSETPKSVYCKYCDLLINKGDMDFHLYHHKHNKSKPIDFTIIESDVVFDKEENEINNSNNLKRKVIDVTVDKSDIPKKRLYKNNFSMSYCQTCKCFLTNIALTRKAHVECRCAHIQKHVCSLCGLVLTNKALDTHRKLHRKTNNLKLQDYKFYDLHGKRICPPVPEYPRCDICKVYFLTKVAAKSHICSEQKYLTCQICQVKLSEEAVKLHMSFHNYSMNKAGNPILHPSTSDKLEHVSDSNIQKQIININWNEKLDCMRFQILYSCKSCFATLDTYDKVIEHCQNHYFEKENNVILIKCPKCCCKFDSSCYENHLQLHLRKISFKVLNFDVSYFISENNIWIKHLFGSLPGDLAKTIVAESIYQFEGRIKMEIIQRGTQNLTLYKCDKCNNFVDPIKVYKHAENSCFKIKKNPCSVCGVPFTSSASRISHEKIHKLQNVGIKSFNIVTFNRNEDKTYNTVMFCSLNRYVLYQCRNCNGVVDKSQCKFHKCTAKNLRKCTNCGLLLYKEDYDSHVAKHMDLDAFEVENMKVVMFGNKTETDDVASKAMMPSFNGMLYDYTLYKCIKCEICIKNEHRTLKHACYFGACRLKCPECNLYFFKSVLSQHLKLHESDSEFKRDNLRIITFGASASCQPDNISTKISEDFSIALPEKINNNEIKKVTAVDESEKNIGTIEKVVNIYKCDCGLHFLDELKTTNHLDHCNSRIRAKQNCSKCGLLFTPSELFAHLLAHHGDKTHVYKFDIVEINRKDIKLIYKCSECNLHFMDKDTAAEHNKYCEGNENEGEICSRCNLIFDTTAHYANCPRSYKVIVTNEKVSEMLTTKNDGMENLLLEADLVRDSFYNISQKSLSKIDLTKYNSTIYKCNKCNVHYLTRETLKKHIGVGKHDLVSIKDVCNICGLNFTLQSLAKHMYVHHQIMKLTSSDLIITAYIYD